MDRIRPAVIPYRLRRLHRHVLVRSWPQMARQPQPPPLWASGGVRRATLTCIPRWRLGKWNGLPRFIDFARVFF